jgi:hypothetical protein
MSKADGMGLATGIIGEQEPSGTFIGAEGFFVLVDPPRGFNSFPTGTFRSGDLAHFNATAARRIFLILLRCASSEYADHRS